MSRYCGGKETEQKFQILEKWKNQCLLGGGSIFDLGSVWNAENVDYLKQYFVDNLNYGSGDFISKLEGQLAPIPSEAKQLCAEIMWLMLFCPSNIKPASKRKTINTIMAWSGETIPETCPALADEIFEGFGSGGTAYNTLRWMELVYLIRLLESFYRLSESERFELVQDATNLSTWLENIEDNESRQFRHMFLFMLFPDEHERIFGNIDRRKIAAAFSGKSDKDFLKFTARQLDDELRRLRLEQVKEFGTEQLDWYVPPLRALWQNTSKKGTTEADEIYPVLQQFLEQAKTPNLATKQYPATHQGLTMRVSFGAGNQAHVPWIGFLTPGQSPTKGIYPVYLYYKEDNLLILAKGVSSTNKSEADWEGDELVTVEEYFIETLGKKPIRYGESYIVADYDLNEDLEADKIEADLADLLAEYKEQLGDMGVKEPEATYSQSVDESLDIDTGVSQIMSFDEAIKGLFLPRSKIENILDLLQEKKNIVLQGPPGVGKTYISKRLAYALLGENDKNRVELVQFHQSYSYEDFIQGYRPGDSGFDLKNGVFHQFCSKAQSQPDKPYVFIIDEINRGNLSKIFGELMMLIESDKRGPEWALPLTYCRDISEKFYVPENVHIIGLMNTADRSLSLVDYALRRRFAFIDLQPEFKSESFTRYLADGGASEGMISTVISKLGSLNEQIASDTANLGPGFMVGHSFFCTPPNNGLYDGQWFEKVVRYEIAPLLSEYWFDDPGMVENLVSELLA